MCLRVFTDGNEKMFQHLRPAAMKLGAAFQKVNFLRDLQGDYASLGRTYFPGVNLQHFTEADKLAIEADIAADFEEALKGIRKLPASSRFGVYVAYVYYHRLFRKIQSLSPRSIMSERIRIPNYEKLSLLVASFFRHSLRML
jgi:phytoene/squalene synthetase